MQVRAPDPFAVALLAEIHERQGRVDEAIALLHTRSTTSINNRDQLADLLARHDRIEELREYAASEYHGHAAQRLAELLEERGDVAGAIAVYQQRVPDSSSGAAVRLAELLARQGRGDEALEVLRSLADSNGADDWLIDLICELYAAQGRAGDGLAYLDALAEEQWEFFRMRLPLLVACGRREEAIALVEAHPESDTWYAAEAVAELLTDAGRAEEATAVLEKHGTMSTLAAHLIELGRIEDAVSVLQQHEPRPAAQSWTGTTTDSPPF